MKPPAEQPATYPNWTAIAQATKQVAARAVQNQQATDTSSQILLARFDRFLSRVFADGNQSEWLLKGGVSMLARVPRSRSTTDIDLAALAPTDLDDAVADLARIAGRDLDDHLRFQLTGTRPTGTGDQQPGVQTRRAIFGCYDADTNHKIGEIPIDIVIGPPPTGHIETLIPASRLELPRALTCHPYRLYPVVDHIADKVCATLTRYAGARSSRVKDLVDLVVIARTQHFNLRELQLAIHAKRTLSQIPPFDHFTIPDTWHRRYRPLAATTPAAADLTDTDDAVDLIDKMVTPALATEPADADLTWTPGTGWTTDPAPDPPDYHHDPDATVWVNTHARSGQPVTGHWRRPRNSGRP